MTKLINSHNKAVTPPARPLPHVRLHDLRHLYATTVQVSGIASDALFCSLREQARPAVQGAACGPESTSGATRVVHHA